MLPRPTYSAIQIIDTISVLAGAAAFLDTLVPFVVRRNSGQAQGVLQAGTPRRRPQPTFVRSALGTRQPEEALLAHRGPR